LQGKRQPLEGIGRLDPNPAWGWNPEDFQKERGEAGVRWDDSEGFHELAGQAGVRWDDPKGFDELAGHPPVCRDNAQTLDE
jgi:hypothetical protein